MFTYSRVIRIANHSQCMLNIISAAIHCLEKATIKADSAVDIHVRLSLSKRQILDSPRLKEFADDNFKFVENGRKFSKKVENPVGKGEIARYEQFLLCPQRFQNTCTADT